MDEKIEKLAKELKLIKELQVSDIYTANYQEAIVLFSLGYRKESDTAREILKEINTILYNCPVIHDDYSWGYDNKFLCKSIEELAKQFGVEIKE